MPPLKVGNIAAAITALLIPCLRDRLNDSAAPSYWGAMQKDGPWPKEVALKIAPFSDVMVAQMVR